MRFLLMIVVALAAFPAAAQDFPVRSAPYLPDPSKYCSYNHDLCNFTAAEKDRCRANARWWLGRGLSDQMVYPCRLKELGLVVPLVSLDDAEQMARQEGSLAILQRIPGINGLYSRTIFFEDRRSLSPAKPNRYFRYFRG